MFERFTDRARQVVVIAQEESRTLKHNYIGTEHILLGLLREEEGLACRVLESLGLTVEQVLEQVVAMMGTGEEGMIGQLPFSPNAKRLLDYALRESLSLGHNYIGTEHILLGLLRVNEGKGARILNSFDEVDSEMVRSETIRVLATPGALHDLNATKLIEIVEEGDRVLEFRIAPGHAWEQTGEYSRNGSFTFRVVIPRPRL